MCHFGCTALAGSRKVGLQLGGCIITVQSNTLDCVFVVVKLFIVFRWLWGFCHRTESDIFLFLFIVKTPDFKCIYKTFVLLVKDSNTDKHLCWSSSMSDRPATLDAWLFFSLPFYFKSPAVDTRITTNLGASILEEYSFSIQSIFVFILQSPANYWMKWSNWQKVQAD